MFSLKLFFLFFFLQNWWHNSGSGSGPDPNSLCLDPQHWFLESKKYNYYIIYRLFSREEVRKAAEITRKELGEVSYWSFINQLLRKKLQKFTNFVMLIIVQVSILVNNAGIMPCKPFLSFRQQRICTNQSTNQLPASDRSKPVSLKNLCIC